MALVDAARAVTLLNSGAPVAIPTETVYGLAARIDDESALHAVFATKARPFFDPLIVHVAEVADARALSTAWSPSHETLATRFWPGPLTLVVPKAAPVSSLITSGLDTVGVRCPRHPLALEIIRQTGPLAAPSANRFGRTSPTTAAHVELEFASAVPVVDGGPCEVGVESTVVMLEGDHAFVLRPGGVSTAELQAALGPRASVTTRHSVRSPGHLEAHYQPANPLILVGPECSDAEITRRLAGRRAEWLTVPADPVRAARTLYADFRDLSEVPGVILVRRTAQLEQVAFEAIFDRVRRAASDDWA